MKTQIDKVKNEKEKQQSDTLLNQIQTSISQDNSIILKNKNKCNDLETTIKKEQDDINQIVEKNIKIWNAEKVTVIHNIDQESISNLTYKKSFDKEWKYDVLKMLLCNVLKNTLLLDDKIKLSNDVDFKASCIRDMIFELFKNECFKSGKLKNMVLYIDNYKIDSDDSYNVYSINSSYHYSKFIESLDQNKRLKYTNNSKQFMNLSKTYKYFHYIKDKIYEENEKEILNKNREFINVWIPILCTIQEIINLSVANERIKEKEKTINNVKKIY